MPAARTLLAVGSAVLLVALGVLALRQPAGDTELPAPREQREDLRAALRDLERERGERERLSQEVRELRARLEILEWAVVAPGTDAQAAHAPPSEAAAAEPAPAPKAPRARAPSGFDRPRLLEAGVDDFEADRLRALWSEVELAKLGVIDQAEREDWPRSRRYEELQVLQESVRDRLDDDSYDRYLYAAGTPNRVVVRDVIDRSPADRAGVLPSDLVMSYDGSRIFGREELQKATSFGDPGESVILEIVRAGQSRLVTVPRGPLGLLLMSQSHEPR